MIFPFLLSFFPSIVILSAFYAQRRDPSRGGGRGGEVVKAHVPNPYSHAHVKASRARGALGDID